MFEQMTYEAANERMAEYRRQGERARLADEAKAIKRSAKARNSGSTMATIEEVIGRWGWQIALTARN